MRNRLPTFLDVVVAGDGDVNGLSVPVALQQPVAVAAAVAVNDDVNDLPGCVVVHLSTNTA